MSELLKLLSGPLLFLLTKERFRIVNSSTGASFGDASVTLRSEYLQLELVRDRSQISVRFRTSATEDQDDWYWLGVLRRYFNKESPGSDQLDSEGIEFLDQWIGLIGEIAADDLRRAELLDQLAQEREERSNELFGT